MSWKLPSLEEAIDLTLAWPDELPLHLSASSLTMYHRCRHQWSLRYLHGLKEPPKGYRVWGSADSATAEHNYRQKIDSHEDVGVNEIREVFAVAVDELVEQYGGESQIEWDAGETATTVKDRGVELAALYHRQAAPRVQPIGAEQRIDILIPGVPIPVIGYIDVETEHATIERKTGRSKFRLGKPDGNYVWQARIYQLAQRKPVHWHLSTKTKLPAVYTPAEEPGMLLDLDEAELERTELWVQTTVRAILADYEMFGDEPWPDARALRDSPCSWCGFGPNGTRGCAWWK